MVGKWVVCSQVPVRLSFLCQDVLEYITGFRETWLLRQKDGPFYLFTRGLGL